MGKNNILITGDFCPVNRINELASSGNNRLLFNDFLPQLLNSGMVVTNLECPLTDSDSKIRKSGPSLKGSVMTAGLLADSGFNLVTLANNHIMDFGPSGMFSTIAACRSKGIGYVGVGATIDEARKIFYTVLGDVKIAVLNFSENEFSTTHNNSPGSNPLDPISNYSDIKQAKSEADYVIVIVHGGHEFYNLPSPRIKSTLRFFADAGADAVVQHHAHCHSGYEIYNGIPIFYGLGNFLFDIPEKRDSTWNLGYAVELIPGSDPSFRIIPYQQCNGEVGVKLLGGEQLNAFLENIKVMNEIIADDEALGIEFGRYCARVKKMYLSFLEPHSLQLLHVLQSRKFFPSFLSRKKRTLYSNLIRCESHRDVLIYLLDQDRNVG